MKLFQVFRSMLNISQRRRATMKLSKKTKMIRMMMLIIFLMKTIMLMIAVMLAVVVSKYKTNNIK